MILSWLFYAAWIGGLLGLSALAAEHGLRLAGRPTRLIWLGAMAISILIPGGVVVIRFWIPEAGLALPSVGLSELVLPAFLAAGDAAGSGWTGQRAVDLALAGAWLAGSAALLGLLVHSQRRLRRERAGWIHTEVDGVPVLVSRKTGPATVGSLRPRVVLPEWAVGLPVASREMILRHELEHVRARDGLVALAGFAVAALVPWNPAVWWMLTRLRLAQEMDCDRRLLASGVPVRGYVDLLMTSGRPAMPAALAAPGLSLSRSTLRKRILQMTHIPGRTSWVKAAGVGAVAIGLGLLACDTPAPDTAPGLTGPNGAVVEADQAANGAANGGANGAAKRVIEELDERGTWTSDDGTHDVAFTEDGNLSTDVHLREQNEWVDGPDHELRVVDEDPIQGEYKFRERNESMMHFDRAPLDSEGLDVAVDGDEQALAKWKRANEEVAASRGEIRRRVKLDPNAEAPSLVVLNGEIWRGDAETLKQRLAGLRVETQILSGAEAAVRFGPEAADGAVVIDTEGR